MTGEKELESVNVKRNVVGSLVRPGFNVSNAEVWP